MSIHVALVPNTIRQDGSVCPRVIQHEHVAFDTLLDYMVKDTALERTDMQAVMEKFSEGLAYFTSQGQKVETPAGLFYPTIGPNLVSENDDGFAFNREAIRVGFRAGNGMLKLFKEKLDFVVDENPGVKRPIIMRVTNVYDRGLIDEFAPGHIVHVVGIRMKFDTSDEETGIFFVDVNDTETAHRMKVYSRNGTSYIDFMVDTIPEGEYRVEIRTKPTDREVRSGSYQNPVKVTG